MQASQASLITLVVLAAPPGAEAWDPAYSTTAQPCQWSPVVRVGFHCTGAYVGNGVVLTAAHCLWSTTGNPPVPIEISFSQLDIRFGESQSDPELIVPVLGCVGHPDGFPDIGFNSALTYEGVDLAYCVLDVDTENEEFLAQVPLVPPMIPSGCSRDWLSRAMRGVAPGRPLAMATGMGCDDADCEGSAGTKRFTGVELHRFLATPKQLQIPRFAQTVGLYRGDSGGPLYVRLPDHTWRLVGVNHGTSGGPSPAHVQSVPPYLGWIEWHSGLDITPCHTRMPQTSDYVFTGGCEGMLALDPDAEDDWLDGCAVTLGGPSDAAANECAEWPIGPTSTFLAPSL